MTYCRNCGEKLIERDEFCPSCGSNQGSHEISRNNEIFQELELEDTVLSEGTETSFSKDEGLNPWKAIIYSCITYLVYGSSSSYIFDWRVNDILMYISEIVCFFILLYFAARVINWRNLNGKTLISKIALWFCFGWAILFCWAFVRNLYAFITHEV